jgi:spore coat polysaccharide biosynthesis protein SpsF (cytidylyltransferase family)
MLDTKILCDSKPIIRIKADNPYAEIRVKKKIAWSLYFVLKSEFRYMYG